MKCFSIQDGVNGRDDLEIKYIEYGCDEPEHTHGAIELCYVVSGSGEHVLDGRSIRAGRGTLILLDYQCVHSIHMWESIKYYNVLLQPSFFSEQYKSGMSLQEFLKERYGYTMTGGCLFADFHGGEESQRIEDILFSMLEESVQRKKRFESLIACLLDELVNLLLRKLDEQTQLEQDPLLSEAIAYISKNCAEALRLEDVAKRFNYAPKYFSSKLKEYSGLSFKQLLLRKRLSNVIFNLWKTDQSIDEIIHICGFTNKTYFYETFEKVYGVKPKFIREYRKNYQKYLELKLTNQKMLK